MVKVTVIVASYNHAQYIKETIDSILNQDFEEIIEIIVVDDASTDETKKVLQEYLTLSSLSRKFIFVFKDLNLGLNDSLEQALKLASGEFIQLISSDDVLCPSKIKVQFHQLSNSNEDCIYSRGYFYYDSGEKKEFFLHKFNNKFIQKRALKLVSTQDWGLPLSQSALFKKSVLEQLLSYRKIFKSDDWVILILLMRHYRVGYIDQPLFLYRQHPNNSYKKYNHTLPMRLEVIGNLVEEKWRPNAYSNIFLSHSEYLFADHRKMLAVKFLLCSLVFKVQTTNLIYLLKFAMPHSIYRVFRNIFNRMIE